MFCVCFTFFGDLRRVCFISQHSKILSGMFLRNYIPQEPGAFWMVDKLQIDEIFRSSPSWSPPKPRIHRSMGPLLRCSENAIQGPTNGHFQNETDRIFINSSRNANYMKLKCFRHLLKRNNHCLFILLLRSQKYFFAFCLKWMQNAISDPNDIVLCWYDY